MESTRKRKQAALQPSDWEAQRTAIQKLYLTENKSLAELIKLMRKENGFDATKSQYETWLAKWGFRKYLNDSDWKFVYRQIEKRRRQNKLTSIRVCNTLVSSQKVKNELSRHIRPSQEHTLASSSEICEETPAGIYVSTPATTALGTIRLDNLPWFQFKGFVHSQIRYNRSPDLPPDQWRGLWPDSEEIVPIEPIFDTELEWPCSDMPIYACAIRPVAASSLETMWSVFGLTTSSRTSLPAYDFLIKSLLPQLEVDVPEFDTEEFKQNWEMLPWSSHADTVLHFLEFAVYLSSNNMLEDGQVDAIFQWLVSRRNRPALDALVSSRLPTTQACVHEIFKCALRTGHLRVARALLDSELDFSEVLQSLHDTLQKAVGEGDVELVQFLLEGRVNLSLCADILGYAESVEIARILLQAGADINELSDPYGFHSTALGYAVWNRNLRLAEFLIEEGADINLTAETEGGRGRTPLKAALERGDFRLMELLVNNGAEVDAPSYSWDAYSHRNDPESCDWHWTTPLQAAAARGDVKLATLLLQSSADVDAPGYEMSALHWAIKSGSTEMVRLLLVHGADPNTTADNDYRSTTIQIAAEQGNTDMIQILLAAGAMTDNPADICPLRGQLRQAIRDGCISKVRAMVQSDIDINKPFSGQVTMIREAIVKGDVGMVQLLLEAGADANILCVSHEDHDYMATPLQLTLELMEEDEAYDTPHSNATQIAKILLDSGADPNPPDDLIREHTPLQIAATLSEHAQAYDLVQRMLIAGAFVNAPATGLYQPKTAFQHAVKRWDRSRGFNLLQLLLDYEADVNAPAFRRNGRTALQVAAKVGDIDLVRFLLEAGANVNAPAAYDSGYTALQVAISVGDMDLIRFFLKNGAEVNSPAAHSYGRTALQNAVQMVGNEPMCQAGNPLEIVELLMENGANINAPPAEIYGRTALQAAAAAGNGSIKLIRYLLDAGADVNAPAGGYGGLTALQGAGIRGHIKFALMLLEKGADVNAPGSRVHGRTALEGAAEHGRLDMVQLLVNEGADSHLPGRQRYRSAATYATKEGHFAISNLLRALFEE